MEEYINLLDSWHKIADYLEKSRRGKNKDYELLCEDFMNNLLVLQEKIQELQEEANKYQKFKEQQGKGKRKSKVLINQIEVIRAFKELGHTNEQIAKKLGVTEKTIRNYLKL